MMKADENLSRVRLLMADAVQKDLSLTADQTRMIVAYVKDGKERGQEFITKWRDFLVPGVTMDVSDEKGRELRASFEDFASQLKESRAKVVAMLTPGQSERLRQIQLQHTIATALAKPDLIKALGISEEQLARIRPLSGRIAEKRMANSGELHGLTGTKLRKKSIELSRELDKVEAEANKLALDVLTPQQRAKLDKFLGKEIELTWDYDALVPDELLPW